MEESEDWLPEDEIEDEWSIKDAFEILEAYQENANKKWEVDLLDWIKERLFMYEDLCR